jgi:hypothetical protein
MSLEPAPLRNSLWRGAGDEYNPPEIEPNRKSRVEAFPGGGELV